MDPGSFGDTLVIVVIGLALVAIGWSIIDAIRNEAVLTLQPAAKYEPAVLATLGSEVPKRILPK